MHLAQDEDEGHAAGYHPPFRGTRVLGQDEQRRGRPATPGERERRGAGRVTGFDSREDQRTRALAGPAGATKWRDTITAQNR